MADTAFFLGDGGSIWEMDLPLSEIMQEKLTKGYLTRVNADGSPYQESGEAQPPARPAKSASKAEWVGYAVRAHGVLPDDAEAMTKDDLIDTYGG